MKPTFLIFVAGCWSATQPIDPQKLGVLDVEIASVSLAEDCPDPVLAQAELAGPSSSSVACAQGQNCSTRARARSCEQTTMQLSFRSRDDAGAKIQIKSVELYDSAGKRVGTMTARNPTRWTDGAEYLPWDERVAGRQKMTASYALSAPDRNAGSFDPSETYRVRVVLAIGDEQRTFEKPATVSVQGPAHPEPPMVT